MIEIDLPAVRICNDCGDLAAGETCATCERLGELYDAKYHARRRGDLFSSLPREELVLDDGLGGMRAAATAIKWTAIAAVVMWALGFACGKIFG